MMPGVEVFIIQLVAFVLLVGFAIYARRRRKQGRPLWRPHPGVKYPALRIIAFLLRLYGLVIVLAGIGVTIAFAEPGPLLALAAALAGFTIALGAFAAAELLTLLLDIEANTHVASRAAQPGLNNPLGHQT